MAITKSDQQKSLLGSLAQDGRVAGAGYVSADLGGQPWLRETGRDYEEHRLQGCRVWGAGEEACL